MVKGKVIPIRPGVFRQTESEAFELRMKLEPAALQLLARDVISRVAARAPALTVNAHEPNAKELERFCSMLISAGEKAAHEYISKIVAKGTPTDTVYLLYLGRAARMLGVWWDDDHVSSSDVTLGSLRIYAIMRALSSRMRDQSLSGQKSAVFASVPGETHTLGVKSAADLLQLRGWSIDLKMGRSHEELIEEVASSEAPIVGLSAAGAHAIPALAKLIVSLRIEVSTIKIVVGGNILVEAADKVQAMNPDAIALDMPQAYAALTRIWRSLRTPQP